MGRNRLLEFESINDTRLRAIAYRVTSITDLSKYHVSRSEIVLTERCNMNCFYCGKRLSQESKEHLVEKERLQKNLLLWSRHGCNFVHFTGGEPTLIPYLAELVELSSQLGMKASLTTNGTADENVYIDLVRRGLTGIHLSLDTVDENQFVKTVRRNGFFQIVMRNAQNILELRRQGADVHLTINACVDPNDMDELVPRLESLLSLEPDEIKLMTISSAPAEQWSRRRKVYKERILPQLMALLPREQSMPMLRSRLPRLFDATVRGFHQFTPVRCFLIPEERMVAPDGKYYRCYIHYREGGRPVGSIDNDDFVTQVHKLILASADSSKDTICKEYCADITSMANRLIGNMISLDRARKISGLLD